MSIEAEQQLLHYRLIEKIGEGGMGVVWKALDTTLGREVAIKILPADFSGDLERLARFEREAQVLASLNHPNIAAIYGLHRDGDTRFLAMELVHGENLQQRLARAPLPIDEAIDLAVQMAAGIDAAHERGVVHRDLKPANIVVTPEGGVKVLDFGLAKGFAGTSASGSSAGGGLEHSPTITSVGSVAGVILGTANYMSPEQARGQVVDQRADVWAFGCVLYELFSGRRPFVGETVTDVLAAIVRAEPDWEALTDRVPPSVTGVLKRCLRKNPRGRLRSVGDVGLTLKELVEEDAARPSATAATVESAKKNVAGGRRISVPLATAVVVVVALVAAVLGSRWSRSPSGEQPQRRFSIELPEGVFLPAGVGTVLTVSRDGRTVVYLGHDLEQRRLYVRGINEFEARPIPGTEGVNEPFFSPDGEWVGFSDNEGLKKVSLSSNEIYPICDTCGHGSWGDDGNIYVNKDNALWRVPETGGELELLLAPTPEKGIPGLVRPLVLPGSKLVLFETGQYTFGGASVLDLESGEVFRITDSGADPFYSLSGHVVFARTNGLFAVPFDAQRFRATGRETPVLQGARVENGGALQAATTDAGMLVYAPAGATVGTRLTWVDRQGQREPIGDQWRLFMAPRVSPGGGHVAVVVNDGGKLDIWLVDVDSGGMVPLTASGAATDPVWTPDGKRITYAEGATRPYSIRSISAAGGVDEQIVLTSDHRVRPEAWHPHGDFLIYTESRENDDLFLFDTAASSSTPLVTTDAKDCSAAFSPDGTKIAYSSKKTGIDEVYLRPFPGPGPEIPVSIGGGKGPLWSADGSELLYRDELRFTAASIDGLRVTNREAAFGSVFFWFTVDRTHADAHPDGKRFLVLEKNEAEARPGINVVLNWAGELAKRAPAGR